MIMEPILLETLDVSTPPEKPNSLKTCLTQIFNKCMGCNTKSDSSSKIPSKNQLDLSVVTIDGNFGIPEYNEVPNSVILFEKAAKENSRQDKTFTPLTERKRGNRQPCVIDDYDYDSLFPQKEKGLYLNNVSEEHTSVMKRVSHDYVNYDINIKYFEDKDLRSKQMLGSEQYQSSNTEKYSLPLLVFIELEENTFNESKLQIDIPTPKTNENSSNPFWKTRRSNSPQYLPMGRTTLDVNSISLHQSTDATFDVYSLYSTVDKSAKKKRTETSVVCPPTSTDNNHNNIDKTVIDSFPKEKVPDSPWYVFASDDDDYASIDFEVESKVEELTREISKLRDIVEQVWKAIHACKRGSKLYGSVHHVEAERILLLSAYKMDILNKELAKEENCVQNQQSSGTIILDSLRFLRNSNAKPEKEQHYMCIIHSGTSVIATDIVSSKKAGEIIFKNGLELTFDTALSELEVKINIYSVNIQKRRINGVDCLFSPRRIYWYKKAKRIGKNSTQSERSPVQLLGSSRIGVKELSCEDKFKLTDVPPHVPLSNTFEANVSINVRLNNKFSGFLTVYTQYTLWNRRWCVLDGSLLKYWNCASHEKEQSPIRIIDLQKCAEKGVLEVDESTSKPYTFGLELKSENMFYPETYLFSADSRADFMKWKEHIDTSIEMVRNWSKLKCKLCF